MKDEIKRAFEQIIASAENCIVGLRDECDEDDPIVGELYRIIYEAQKPLLKAMEESNA